MSSFKLGLGTFLLALSLAAAPAIAQKGEASASVKVSISVDVNASGKADAVAGDKAYAAGEFQAALAAYGAGFAKTRDAAFIYAMAECHKALGHKAEAEAMFKMYLSASGGATLKYKGDAETEIGGAKTTAADTAGKVGGALKGAKDKATNVVADVGAGVYGAAKISIAGSMDASAKASAEAADSAYAAGKYEDAAKNYGEAYAKSQQSIALYAEAQAMAQGGHAVEARALIVGYLTAQPKGKFAKDAKTLYLALGGSADASAKISVKGEVSKEAKADAGKGDTAFKAGKYIDAAKSYGDAYAKKSDAALLYAKGMAQYCAGMTADAVTTLKLYLAASGDLKFKAQAQVTIQASGSAAT